MKAFIKRYLKTLLFFAAVGIIGGFFVGLYMLDAYPEDVQNQLAEEAAAAGLGLFPIDILMGIITAVQSAGYGLFLGAAGIYFAKRVGLWRDAIRIEKHPLIIALALGAVGGLLMILPDLLFFNGISDEVAASYASKPGAAYIIATVSYGAVIEEVMLRLFAMSIIAFLLHKLSRCKNDLPSTATLIAANVVSSLLFAAGHLPATFILLGDSAWMIARCFILNGGLGLLFGYLYRKHGLRYAMIAHGGCHVVSKLIWILFL